ncbi:hypothetical protein V496_06590 [Pseudogymnoascus sp. VKM F-4515 (FW-2607)]|nr:hypothetical protein V496_06590 [Pseudogymnoascus sp. VKM F-4515 (FW-2607)]
MWRRLWPQIAPIVSHVTVPLALGHGYAKKPPQSVEMISSHPNSWTTSRPPPTNLCAPQPNAASAAEQA